MRNVERIIGMIRTGEYPEAEIDRLVTEEAATVVEKVVTSASAAGVREHVVAYARQVYAAAADVVRRETRLRTTAALDAADAVARWRAQHDEAMELVRELLPSEGAHSECCSFDALTDEQRAAIERAPVFVARVLIGGHSAEYALRMLAEREAEIAALKAKAERS